MEKFFERDDFQRKDEIQKIKKELEKLELRKSNLQIDLMDREITSQDYEDMKGRLEKEIVLMKAKLLKLQQDPFLFFFSVFWVEFRFISSPFSSMSKNFLYIPV